MAGVGVAVARQVGAELRLVVHLVPDDCVGLAGGAGCAHGENESPVPCHQKQPQNLASLFAVREVAVSGEPTGSEGFAWVWVLWALDTRRDVVNDADGFAVRVAGQRVGDNMVLHLARGLVAGLDSVDGLAGGALQAAVLVAIVVHSNEALEVVLVATLRQAAHRLSPGDTSHTRAFVPRWSGQSLHADGAVLLRGIADFLKVPLHHLLRGLAFAGLFLGGLAAAVPQAGHRLDVALADRWRMEHQLGRAGQADRKSRCTHQDACNACQCRVHRARSIQVLHWNRWHSRGDKGT